MYQTMQRCCVKVKKKKKKTNKKKHTKTSSRPNMHFLSKLMNVLKDVTKEEMPRIQEWRKIVLRCASFSSYKCHVQNVQILLLFWTVTSKNGIFICRYIEREKPSEFCR